MGIRSLRTKVTIGMGLMLLPLLILIAGFVGILQTMINNLISTAEEAEKELIPQVRLEVLICESDKPLLHYIAQGNRVERKNFDDACKKIDSEFKKAIKAEREPEAQDFLRSAQKEWTGAEKKGRELLSIENPVGNPTAMSLMESFHNNQHRSIDLINDAIDHCIDNIERESARAKTIGKWSWAVTIGVLVVALALAGGGGLVLARSIIKPIDALETGANHFAKGELAYRVKPASKDELGHLSNTFNTMASELEKNAAELEQLATHDALTDLLTRREFFRRLAEELRRSSRYAHSFCLLMLDLDRFKRINDEFGHQAGDRVLRKFADLMLENVRADVDIVGRYGGEEFTIILPETSSEEAYIMAERFRKEIDATRFLVGDGKETGITVSIGLAVFPKHGLTEDALIASADKALFDAKRAGRNRVHVFKTSE